MVEVSMQSNMRPGILARSDAMLQVPGMRKGPRSIKNKQAAPLKPPHFIKEWRVFRDMTVEEVAERADLATGTISAIENRTAGFSPESLEAIAKALRVQSGYLLSVNPLDENSIWPLWDVAKPEQRSQIAAHARVVVKSPR